MLGAFLVAWWIMGRCFGLLVADFAASEGFFPEFVTCLLTESVATFDVSIAILPASACAAAGLSRPVMLGILGMLGMLGILGKLGR
jgi:hypothetical protein